MLWADMKTGFFWKMNEVASQDQENIKSITNHTIFSTYTYPQDFEKKTESGLSTQNVIPSRSIFFFAYKQFTS